MYMCRSRYGGYSMTFKEEKLGKTRIALLSRSANLVAFIKDRCFSRNPKAKILLASFPKSGSTYITSVIKRHKKFVGVSLVPAHGQREQELDIRYLSKYKYRSFIARHHIRYSDYLGHLLKDHEVKPIVLVRNIYDCIVSIKDHIRTEGGVCPMAAFHVDHARLTDQRLYEIITDLMVPWYINFYVGWKTSPINPLILTYDSMVNNPRSFFSTIFNKVGITINSDELSSYMAMATSENKRFNVGVSGRGQSLPASLKWCVAKYALYYPSIEFSDIGLD